MEDFDEALQEVVVNVELREKELEHFIQQAKQYTSSLRLLREQLSEYVKKEQESSRLKLLAEELK